MDSGIVSTYCSVDEAIEKGAAPIPLSFDRTVDIQCTIDIMDHLLACEVSLYFFFRHGLTGRNKSFILINLVFHTAGNMAQGSFACSNCFLMCLPFET